MDTNQDIKHEEDGDEEDEDYLMEGESDIVDDSDHIANAQRPLQAVK